jgi:hypothetical protein
VNSLQELEAVHIVPPCNTFDYPTSFPTLYPLSDLRAFTRNERPALSSVGCMFETPGAQRVSHSVVAPGPAVVQLATQGNLVELDKLNPQELALKSEELQLKLRLIELERTRRNIQGTKATNVKISEPQTIVDEVVRHDKLASNTSSEGSPLVIETLNATLKAILLGAGLPKIEVEPFDGSHQDFHRFIRIFESNIAEKLIDVSQKLSYLMYYCRGKAKDAIQHCALLPKETGFSEAMEILRTQFGRPHDIIRAVTKGVLYGPKLVSGDLDALQKLVLQMKGCEATLLELKYQSDLDCTTNLVKVVERLPRKLQERWAEVAENAIDAGREPTFTELRQFIERKVAVSSNVYGQLLNSSPKGHSSNTCESPKAFLARCHATVSSKQTDQSCTCSICSGSHDLTECQHFISQSLEERRKTVRESKRCFICLKPNHVAKLCKVQVGGITA